VAHEYLIVDHSFERWRCRQQAGVCAFSAPLCWGWDDRLDEAWSSGRHAPVMGVNHGGQGDESPRICNGDANANPPRFCHVSKFQAL